MSVQGKDLIAEIFGVPSWADVRTRIEKFKELTGKKKKPEKKVGPKKPRVNEFDSESDFILSMIMIALMHVNPELSPEASVEQGREWARQMWMPNKKYIWRKQAIRIKRHGIRAEASKIRREMFKLL